MVKWFVMLRMRFDGRLEAGMEEDAGGVDEVVGSLEAVVKTEAGGVVDGVVGEMAAMVDEVEAEDTPGVEVPFGVLPCAAAARWACIEDDGWN